MLIRPYDLRLVAVFHRVRKKITAAKTTAASNIAVRTEIVGDSGPVGHGVETGCGRDRTEREGTPLRSRIVTLLPHLLQVNVWPPRKLDTSYSAAQLGLSHGTVVAISPHGTPRLDSAQCSPKLTTAFSDARAIFAESATGGGFAWIRRRRRSLWGLRN